MNECKLNFGAQKFFLKSNFFLIEFLLYYDKNIMISFFKISRDLMDEEDKCSIIVKQIVEETITEVIQRVQDESGTEVEETKNKHTTNS